MVAPGKSIKNPRPSAKGSNVRRGKQVEIMGV